MTNLKDLQTLIGETNGKSGFNDYTKTPDEFKNLYIGNKLMLVNSELAEAQDELRTGRGVTETYYPAGAIPATFASAFSNGAEATDAWNDNHDSKDGLKKPEGFPSEIADAVIRIFGIAYEVGIDLEDIINEKIAYNATRGFKHGKQF